MRPIAWTQASFSQVFQFSMGKLSKWLSRDSDLWEAVE